MLRRTVLPTYAMLNSDTGTSTWAAPHASSSPLSQTGVVDSQSQHLLPNVQVLHHPHPIAPLDHGRSTFWARWHRKD